MRPNPAANPSAERAVIDDWFPQLEGKRLDVTSESTRGGGYNCIGWAVGDCTREWSPNAKPGDPPHKLGGYSWPRGLPFDTSLSTFEQLFGRLGYEACPSAELEPGHEKVVLYGTKQGVLHAARQEEGGEWLSKMGEAADIRLARPEQLEGKFVGEILKVFRRPRIGEEEAMTRAVAVLRGEDLEG